MKQNSEKVTPMLVEQTMTGSSLLSQNKLQRYVKSKVGNAFQDKVDLFFEFLLSHLSLSKCTSFRGPKQACCSADNQV